LIICWLFVHFLDYFDYLSFSMLQNLNNAPSLASERCRNTPVERSERAVYVISDLFCSRLQGVPWASVDVRWHLYALEESNSLLQCLHFNTMNCSLLELWLLFRRIESSVFDCSSQWLPTTVMLSAHRLACAACTCNLTCTQDRVNTLNNINWMACKLQLLHWCKAFITFAYCSRLDEIPSESICFHGNQWDLRQASAAHIQIGKKYKLNRIMGNMGGKQSNILPKNQGNNSKFRNSWSFFIIRAGSDVLWRDVDPSSICQPSLLRPDSSDFGTI
jgi:hypothetical protein